MMQKNGTFHTATFENGICRISHRSTAHYLGEDIQPVIEAVRASLGADFAIIVETRDNTEFTVGTSETSETLNAAYKLARRAKLASAVTTAQQLLNDALSALAALG